MKERPIIFGAESVRAILDGWKSMTRRVVKFPNGGMPLLNDSVWWDDDDDPPDGDGTYRGCAVWECDDKGGIPERFACPFGQPGDRLWVRESGKITAKGYTGENGERWSYGDGCWKFKEDGVLRDTNQVAFGPNWKSVPSIHMPRWASRIELEVLSIRVERLQEISEKDAEAEGCWDSLNPKHPWDSNPWVWVVEFGRIP